MEWSVRPEDIPDDVVENIYKMTGLPRSEIRQYAAFFTAANMVGLWQRMLMTPQGIEQALDQLEGPLRLPPLPDWSESVLKDLHINIKDAGDAATLLRRLIAFVGNDEGSVRSFLATQHPSLKMPIDKAVREYGLVSLDQLLRDISVGGMS